MDCEKHKRSEHTHKGKSSESILDKNVILEHLSVETGQAVLDAGCGNGYMAKAFAGLVGSSGRVYALDPDAEAIAVLKRETEGVVIEPFVGDITQETPLTEASLDLVYISTVLHGFSPQQMTGFRGEVNRLLKEGGRLAVLEIKKEETPFGPPMDIRFSAEELQQAIRLNPTLLIDVGQYFYMQVFKK